MFNPTVEGSIVVRPKQPNNHWWRTSQDPLLWISNVTEIIANDVKNFFYETKDPTFLCYTPRVAKLRPVHTALQRFFCGQVFKYTFKLQHVYVIKHLKLISILPHIKKISKKILCGSQYNFSLKICPWAKKYGHFCFTRVWYRVSRIRVSKLNTLWWFGFRLEPISKNPALPKNNHLALLNQTYSWMAKVKSNSRMVITRSRRRTCPSTENCRSSSSSLSANSVTLSNKSEMNSQAAIGSMLSRSVYFGERIDLQ